MTNAHITIHKLDYQDPLQVEQLIGLLNDYAMDPMGGDEALPEATKQRLAEVLPKQTNMFSLDAKVDGIGVALCNCVWGFSTFAAKPLINIHDLSVMADYRGKGLSQALLQGVVDVAKAEDAVKVTLEVLANNEIAQNAYRRFGFAPYELANGGGGAEFWQYKLK